MGREAFHSFNGSFVGGVDENIKRGFIEISFSHFVTHTHTHGSSLWCQLSPVCAITAGIVKCEHSRLALTCDSHMGGCTPVISPHMGRVL